MPENDQKKARSGRIALTGAPNVGKSTLCNALCERPIAVATHKAQTTRIPVRGIFHHDEAEVILIDTPGLVRPRRHLERAMVRWAFDSASEVERIALLVDAQAPRSFGALDVLLERTQGAGQPIDLIVNKVDRIAKPDLLPLVDDLRTRAAFSDVFMVSALKNRGLARLKESWSRGMPEGAWRYGGKGADLRDNAVRSAEVTRKHILLLVHEEVPYETSVKTLAVSRTRKGFRITQTIFVARPTQRAIIIGSGGQTLRKIGMASREELASVLGAPVDLFLDVKVRPGWMGKPERYAEVGLMKEQLPKAARQGAKS